MTRMFTWRELLADQYIDYYISKKRLQIPNDKINIYKTLPRKLKTKQHESH